MGALGSRNDPLKSTRAESQHPAHPMPGSKGLARYAGTRAASARLNVRNVAGVLKPANPGPGSNGKSLAAWSSVLAESSSESACLYAESLETNGASDWPTPRFTSIG